MALSRAAGFGHSSWIVLCTCRDYRPHAVIDDCIVNATDTDNSWHAVFLMHFRNPGRARPDRAFS